MNRLETDKIARSDGFAASLLRDAKLPNLVLLRQRFDPEAIADVSEALTRELRGSGVLETVKPGMKIAVTGGSRGIASYADLLRTLVVELKRVGARPFVFPAMGSHGGATAEGQLEVLESLGITEAAVGCPVTSSMETLRVADTDDGNPVYADRTAWEADGIVLVNRIKYHTGFVGAFESGLVKMSVIGLGKQKGAEACHALRLERMTESLRMRAEKIFAHGKILFGVATVENAYDRIRILRAIPAARIFDEEPGLLDLAKAGRSSLPVDETDVLIVDEIGKNISGGGMDPHVVGRFVTPAMSGGVKSRRLVVLDITDESKGSGIGLGRADLTTQRAFEKFDFEQTYPNALTSNVLEPSRIPLVLADDFLAIAAAVKTCTEINQSDVRIIRIKNSLEIDRLYVTENLLGPALATGRVEILSDPSPFRFDERRKLDPFPASR